MTKTIHAGPDGDGDFLDTIHYTWLANITRDWAEFVRSFLHSCVLHREHRVRHAPAVHARHGLQEANLFFEELRMRYLTVVQKAHGPYHRSPYEDIATLAPYMPANELAFDRAVYDIFFGGPRAADRPQQTAKRLQFHCDRMLTGPLEAASWGETAGELRYATSLLVSIETVAEAVDKVKQRVQLCCETYRVDPTTLTAVTGMEEPEDDDELADKYSDLDYQYCK